MTRTITLTRHECLAAHPLDSPYVADVWAAVLGPTATMLITRARQLWAVQGDPATVDAFDLARWLGTSPARNADTAKRLVAFGAATWDAETQTLAIRTHLPDLTPRQLERAGPIVRRIHDALTAMEMSA